MAVTQRKQPQKNPKTSTTNGESKKDGAKKTDTRGASIFNKVLTKLVMGTAIIIVVYLTNQFGKQTSFAKQNEILQSRALILDCSDNYKEELEKFPGCVPEKCGRFVSDRLVTANEADSLLKIAKSGLALGGSDGGAAILDLHSGALSKGQAFTNIYGLKGVKDIFNKADLTAYKVVRTKIQHAIAHNFGVDADKIHLTHPTFFSEISNKAAVTIHDEYWHPHVDKETYKSFHYTSLLYLNNFGKDFQGGRFVFMDQNNVNSTVEPRKARVSMFTSGWENPHFVEKVTSGKRYAITISFTCDPEYAISDPGFQPSE